MTPVPVLIRPLAATLLLCPAAGVVLAPSAFQRAQSPKANACAVPGAPRRAADLREWMQREEQGNFGGRPPERCWSSQLNSVVQSGNHDPCQADIVSAMDTPSGFGSRINNFMDEVWLAVYAGRSMALWEEDDFIKSWRKYFETPLGFCNASTVDWSRKWGASTAARPAASAMAKVDREYVMKLKSFIYSKMYKYTEATSGLLARRLRDVHGEDSCYVGVHVRSGDKVFEALDFNDYGNIEYGHTMMFEKPQISVPVMAPLVEAELRRTGCQAVHLATDEEDAMKILREQLSKNVTVRWLPRRGRAAYRMRGAYEDEESLLDVLADVEALRRSASFVGMASSHLSRLVYWLRGPGRRSVSADDDGDWLRRG